MSIFATCSIKVKALETAKTMAQARGWRVETPSVYMNPHSRENVPNPLLFIDGHGTVKLAIDQQTGDAYVDPYYMGRDYETFLRDYSGQVLTAQAQFDEGYVSSQYIDPKTNELVIEVEV